MIPERLTQEEQGLRRMAEELGNKHGCLGMKMSTEDMGDSFEWISIIANRVLGDVMPVYVKIGGPNARGDLKQVYRHGLAGAIAPMVESHYALKEYVLALRTVFPRSVLDNMLRGFNAETILCYENLDKMLEIPEAKELNHVSVGRGDLYRSMGKTWDDPEVLRITKTMVEKIQAFGVPVSVASPTPDSARMVAETIRPDKVNAANVYLSVHDAPDIREAFRQALIFENALTQYRYTRVMEEAGTYERILEARKARMEGRDASLH
jgi:hypothetical protein